MRYWVPRILLTVAICGALALGLVRRVDNPRIAMCSSTDEFGELMSGLRPHALPLTNLSADIRSTYIKSLFYSHHGLGDAGFYYLASGALGALRLSPSDRHLWLAGALTNGLLIAAVAWFSLRVAGSPAMAYTATLLLALSPLYVFVSQTAWGRLSFTPLLQVLAVILAWQSRRRPTWLAHAALAFVVVFMTLTDGFYFGGVLVVFLFLGHDGSPLTRVRRLLRDGTFRWTAAAIATGLAIDFGAGAGAIAQRIQLTLFGYVAVRMKAGGVLSVRELAGLWFDAVRAYLPFAGAYLVLPAWLFAIRRAWSDSAAGAIAAWFAVASYGAITYYNSYAGSGRPQVGPLTTYAVALPEFLVVAWACGQMLDARRALIVRAAGAAAVAVTVAPLAFALVTERYGELDYRGGRYPSERDRCAVVKAASVYVREEARPGATVFQMATEPLFGFMGEFYYGLSYLSNLHTGERNRLLDYGELAYGRPHPPERIAEAYGVPHFDYYVEFVPARDAMTPDAVRRLAAAGAKVVLDIRDRGTTIGRVWSFEDRPVSVMDVAESAARWDRATPLSKLFPQPLAGTAWHFGLAWPHVTE
jgi:hypothetical protein